MFDTELLRSFVAVAQNGGFTRAAKMLNSTQSTISAQIRRLEDEAGRALFVRSTRSVQLTSAGEMLLGYARTILCLNEDARLRLSGARHVGRLRVGAAEDLADTWLPEVLRCFGRHRDGLRRCASGLHGGCRSGLCLAGVSRYQSGSDNGDR